MASNLTQVFNLALSAVGTRTLVSIDTENSREAEICRVWYDIVLAQVMRAAPWQCARSAARLALLAQADLSRPWQSGDPEPGWLFAYKLPTDFVYPRFLADWSQFVLGMSGENATLCCNTPEAVLVYTKLQQTIPAWDADLVTAITNGLAAAIAMPLHGKTARMQLALSLANEAIVRARVHAGNESVNVYDSVPDWLSARGVGPSPTFNKFVYPVGPLLSSFGMTS